MQDLLDNPCFRADYVQLRNVKLNPARHTAANAHAHCEMVVARATHLAALNASTPEETQILRNLGYAHDIGKIRGTANPEKSVELLPRYGIEDEPFIQLVKYHDTNLPWYLAAQRGQPPSDKAWRKVATKVNLRLLCLFMVADRVDCPGGWRANLPAVWFLQEAQNRCLLTTELRLDDGSIASQAPGSIFEVCAGAALVRESVPCEMLVIRVRSAGYELPNGHLEWDETPEQAANRELREETGLIGCAKAGDELGTLEYSIEKDGVTVHKRVHYFLFKLELSETTVIGPKPSKTKELRWINEAEVTNLPLVNEELRPLLSRCFRAFPPAPVVGIIEG